MSNSAYHAHRTTRAQRAKKVAAATLAAEPAHQSAADLAALPSAPRNVSPNISGRRVRAYNRLLASVRWVAKPSPAAMAETLRRASSYTFMYDGRSEGVVLSDGEEAIAVWDDGTVYYVEDDMPAQHDPVYHSPKNLAKAIEHFARWQGE